MAAGREKVKVFGAWLDADIAGRKAGQGNKAAGLIARADRGEELSDAEKAEVRTSFSPTSSGVCSRTRLAQRGSRATFLVVQEHNESMLDFAYVQQVRRQGSKTNEARPL